MNKKSNGKIKVGIGFATGRKHFQRVLNTYVYNWKESGLVEAEKVELNLFVAYDLQYNNTKPSDYTNICNKLTDMIENIYFVDAQFMLKEIDSITGSGVISKDEADLFFRRGRGYAVKRNAVLYTAIKAGMDCLLFLDDDEYPMAVSRIDDELRWSGQHILATHLRHIKNADLTNGRHCGYISPIPYINFDNSLTENDFRMFIEAISNDIINWDTINSVMKNFGVTYADMEVLSCDRAEEVNEIMGSKFISGANLCINLNNPQRVMPFYNPPGARGEDTFLGTCLSDRKVLKLPCYTFHDGFTTYKHLLSGVLPIALKPVLADDEHNINRFYAACVGWIRYKPLLLYITQNEVFEEKIKAISEKLNYTMPKICKYFGRNDFMKVISEFELYSRNVVKHHGHFLKNMAIWEKICRFLVDERE